MISGDEIPRLIQILDRRGVVLYHACQFTDFRSYLQLGGVPSRLHLITFDQPYTVFQTDNTDHQVGVWDKVFINLSDFGWTFANGFAATPNPYGPILLHLHPAALNEASDVAFCLRSAGAEGYDRESESLRLEDIDRLFAKPVGQPGASYIKFAKDLRIEFGLPNARDPEISCSVTQGCFSMKHVAVATVDNYVIDGQGLYNIVEKIKTASGAHFPLRRRFYKNNRDQLLPEITKFIIDTPRGPSLTALLRDETLSGALREWASELQTRKLGYQFDRFVEYLREGTLLPLLAGVEHTTASG